MAADVDYVAKAIKVEFGLNCGDWVGRLVGDGRGAGVLLKLAAI